MNAFRSFFRGLSLRPQGATIVVAGFLPIFAIVSMFPIVASMIQHFADDPDAKSKVPMMVTAPGLTIALLAPFAGFFVDRFGRRRLLLWSTFFYGIFGTAPFLLQDLDHIMASRLALGVCEAGILTIVNTLIADYWDVAERRNWLFLQGLVGPFLSSGVILVSGMVASIRWNGGFLVYLVAFPVFVAMLAFLFEPTKPGAPSVASDSPAMTPTSGAFPLRTALGVALVTFLGSCLYYVFIVNGSLAFQEIGVSDPARLSQLTALPTLCILIGAFVFKALSSRSNAFQISVFLGLLGLGLAGIGMARTVPMMLAALMIQQTGAGMAVPTLIAWAQTHFPFEHRGRGMGVWTGAFFLGQFGSPVIVHQLDRATGSIQGAFLAAGVAALLATVAAAVIGMRRTQALAPAKA